MSLTFGMGRIFLPPSLNTNSLPKLLYLRDACTSIGGKGSPPNMSPPPDPVKIDTYYRRHEKVDPPAENFGDKKNPSKGYIMWKMMGGNSGQSWSRRLKKTLDVIQKKERLKKINTTLEAIQLGMVR